MRSCASRHATTREFRKKIDGLFRELHTIKGEASAVNLLSAAHRVHALEDMVSELKKSTELSGNDFLPIVLEAGRADGASAQRARARHAPRRLCKGSGQHWHQRRHATGSCATATAATEFVQTLECARRKAGRASIARASSSRRNGLADVPQPYRHMVKDVLIQMLRNAAVHGIETADTRRAAAKAEIGTGARGFPPRGHGLRARLRGRWRRPQSGAAEGRGGPQAARHARRKPPAMDNRAVMALIFKPGFSTQDEVSMDAGRGVGMDVVARSIYAVGGKIGVATNPGKFTRFKIALPAVEDRARRWPEHERAGLRCRSEPRLQAADRRRFEHHAPAHRALAAVRGARGGGHGGEWPRGDRALHARPIPTSSPWTSRCRTWTASSASRSS